MDRELKLIVPCDSCSKSFDCQSSSVGGQFICGKCYPIWFKGILKERSDWEKWTGKTFLEMCNENDKHDEDSSSF